MKEENQQQQINARLKERKKKTQANKYAKYKNTIMVTSIYI